MRITSESSQPVFLPNAPRHMLKSFLLTALEAKNKEVLCVLDEMEVEISANDYERKDAYFYQKTSRNHTLSTLREKLTK